MVYEERLLGICREGADEEYEQGPLSQIVEAYLEYMEGARLGPPSLDGLSAEERQEAEELFALLRATRRAGADALPMDREPVDTLTAPLPEPEEPRQCVKIEVKDSQSQADDTENLVDLLVTLVVAGAKAAPDQPFVDRCFAVLERIVDEHLGGGLIWCSRNGTAPQGQSQDEVYLLLDPSSWAAQRELKLLPFEPFDVTDDPPIPIRDDYGRVETQVPTAFDFFYSSFQQATYTEWATSLMKPVPDWASPPTAAWSALETNALHPPPRRRAFRRAPASVLVDQLARFLLGDEAADCYAAMSAGVTGVGEIATRSGVTLAQVMVVVTQLVQLGLCTPITGASTIRYRAVPPEEVLARLHRPSPWRSSWRPGRGLLLTHLSDLRIDTPIPQANPRAPDQSATWPAQAIPATCWLVRTPQSDGLSWPGRASTVIFATYCGDQELGRQVTVVAHDTDLPTMPHAIATASLTAGRPAARLLGPRLLATRFLRWVAYISSSQGPFSQPDGSRDPLTGITYRALTKSTDTDGFLSMVKEDSYSC